MAEPSPLDLGATRLRAGQMRARGGVAPAGVRQALPSPEGQGDPAMARPAGRPGVPPEGTDLE
eukprot:5290847-Alexandrium_andersonii.AAC.1